MPPIRNSHEAGFETIVSVTVSDRPEPRIVDRGMRGQRPLMTNSL